MDGTGSACGYDGMDVRYRGWHGRGHWSTNDDEMKQTARKNHSVHHSRHRIVTDWRCDLLDKTVGKNDRSQSCYKRTRISSPSLSPSSSS